MFDFSPLGIDAVHAGGFELAQRIVPTVRDANWAEIPATVATHRVDVDGDGFKVLRRASFRQDDVDLTAEIEIDGTRDGTLRCVLRGEAAADFAFRRIGWTVLLGSSTYVGGEFTAWTRGQASSRGDLSASIAPQKVLENGVELPMFAAFDEIEIRLREIKVALRIEGDLLEMEDQRNWTDPSFKAYCTPLAISVGEGPLEALSGKRFEQTVTLSVRGQVPARGISTSCEPALRIGGPEGRLPEIGTAVPHHGISHTSAEIDRLAALELPHVRAEVNFAGPDPAADLDAAIALSSAIGSPLELTLLLSVDPRKELSTIGKAISKVRVSRIVVLDAGSAVTSDNTATLATELLGTGLVPRPELVGGTMAYFTQVNGHRPSCNGFDGVCWSVNPQIHAFDAQSIAATLPIQAETVQTAQSIYPNCRLHVTPISLRPGFEFDAGETYQQADDFGSVPANVDPRQAAPFCAAWTIGSIASLARANAASATYFESTGWRGLMEVEDPPYPEWSPWSAPGALFPAYHVLAALRGMSGCVVLQCEVEDGTEVTALAVQDERETKLLLGSLSDRPSTLRVEFPEAVSLTARNLDEAGADGTSRRLGRSREHELHLAPNAIVELASKLAD